MLTFTNTFINEYTEHEQKMNGYIFIYVTNVNEHLQKLIMLQMFCLY